MDVFHWLVINQLYVLSTVEGIGVNTRDVLNLYIQIINFVRLIMVEKYACSMDAIK